MSYNEFELLQDNAGEVGLPFDGPPSLRRVTVPLDDGRKLSAIVWGDGDPELVLVHGGAQNAHTWDTVALALGRPLVAIDLPGHGHSDWREDGRYGPLDNAPALATAVEALAPRTRVVVGMSLGGLSSAVLASQAPELVERLVLVDVTPGVNQKKAAAIVNFVRGPEVFESFDAILARTVEHNPTRSRSSLRRGVLHNAKELAGGQWTWRYDRRRFEGTQAAADGDPDGPAFFGSLWDHFSKIAAPLMLCRGSLSPVVDDDDVAELLRRQPEARIEVVDGAGHSIQGDRPLELARLLEDFGPFGASEGP